MTTLERCPDHSSDVPFLECPEDCGYLIAELERRIDEVKGGHFFRAIFSEDGIYSQEYENHSPVGDIKLRFKSAGNDQA